MGFQNLFISIALILGSAPVLAADGTPTPAVPDVTFSSVELLSEALHVFPNFSEFSQQLGLLNSKLPTFKDRRLFMISWGTDVLQIVDDAVLAQKFKAEGNQAEYEKLARLGVQSGSGQFQIYTATTDERVYTLLDTKALAAPLVYALVYLDNNEWKLFKTIVLDLLWAGQAGLVQMQQDRKRAKLPDDFVDASWLAYQIHRLFSYDSDSIFGRQPVSEKLLEQVGLRKLELMEMAFSEKFLTASQKDEFATDFLRRYKGAQKSLPAPFVDSINRDTRRIFASADQRGI